MHPTPGADASIALAYDVLAALGKPVLPSGPQRVDPARVWLLAATWILATPIIDLTLLRAHLLTPPRFRALHALRRRTGVRLVLVCHRADMRTFLERELRQVEHRIAEARAMLPETVPAAERLRTLQTVRPWRIAGSTCPR
ncbi:hypothetical protein ACIRO3_30135 [Streptomyces sp. NPDC102278]|uniref:hypothetical protein n=1 Tax=Streptomyces sp. NPDC102278 TaxID=3366152 RepID=UPI003810130C